jgi:transposase
MFLHESQWFLENFQKPETRGSFVSKYNEKNLEDFIFRQFVKSRKGCSLISKILKA